MKKLLLPITITVLSIVAQVIYASVFLYMDAVPFIAKIIIEVILGGTIFASVWVLIERIREIKKGEDDDLGEY